MTFTREELSQFEEVVRSVVREELANSQKSEFVTMEEIASDLCRSREWVRIHPWSMPNFGVPDVNSRPKQWRRDRWEEWKKELEEHRRQWELMSPSERSAMRRSA